MEDIRSDSLRSLQADEALVTDYQADDNSALDVLYRRYYNQIGFYIRKQSSYKDPSFIDDVRQIVFLKMFTIYKAGKFQPTGPGSFRSFLYETAWRICFDQNEKRMGNDRPVSEIFTPACAVGTADRDEELSAPDELCYRQPETKDYDLINDRVKDVLSKLTPEEQKLMWLLTNVKENGKKYTYKEIQAILLHPVRSEPCTSPDTSGSRSRETVQGEHSKGNKFSDVSPVKRGSASDASNGVKPGFKKYSLAYLRLKIYNIKKKLINGGKKYGKES
jgi:RNA polymerase sigma factor (sigma-70 family)